MFGTLQLLVTIVLLIAGASARSPPGQNGIQYYNFGGKPVTAKKLGIMREWKDDRWVAKSPGSKTFATSTPIITDWFLEIYQSQRYMPNSKTLWINFFVRPGEYSIQMLFSEIFVNGPNQRLFKIKLNGMWYSNGQFEKNPNKASVIDIWSMAKGKFLPRVLTVHVMDASKGSINIQIVPITQNAFISGVIIAPVRTLASRKTPALWTAKGNTNP